MISKLKIWLFLATSVFLAFGASLKFGFFQDDYFHLFISQASSITDFLKFFLPQPNQWVFFRPLSTQVYYLIFPVIFGFNQAPFWMHLFMLFLHSTNAFLVYYLIKRLPQFNHRSALSIAFLYSIWGIHFMSLYYIGATQELLATFFTLLATYFIIKPSVILSVLMVIFALLSKELSVRFPIFLLAYLGLFYGSWHRLKSAWRRFLPTIILVIAYLGFRFIVGINTPSEYQFNFSIFTIIATMMWYFLFTLGFPEYLIYFGKSRGLIDFEAFIKSIHIYGLINFVVVCFIFLFFIYAILRSFKQKQFNHVFFIVGWLSSILPVIFLPNHRYAHYLDLGTIFFFSFIWFNIHRHWRKLFLVLAITTSLTSLAIDYQTHWSVKRAKIAQHLSARFFKDNACQYSVWYLTGSSDVLQQVKYALLWDNFLPVFCGQSVKVVYNKPSGDCYLLQLTESDLTP